MKAKFTLMARVAGKFEAVEFKKGVPSSPAGATSFYVRFSEDGKRHCKPLGKDLTQAVAALRNYELGREFESRGMEMPVTLIAEQTSLSLRIDAYLDETKANKEHKTWQAYSNSLAKFKASCKRSSVQSVAREDLLAFKSYLRGEELSERAVYNNFLNVMVFLKWAGVSTRVQKSDWPEKVERQVEIYEDEDLKEMFEAAHTTERLIMKSFLFSGLRSGEMAHLTYGDIDFKNSIWKVQPKDGWKTKTKESRREVPVPESHTKKILARMEASKHELSDLIFPNSQGAVNKHLVRIVQRVAHRAGIRGRVDDHKFRSTCATRWLREGATVEDVRRWLGHGNLETVGRYLEAINLRSAETQKKISKTFAKFAATGGD